MMSTLEWNERLERQRQVAAWCIAAFGSEQMLSSAHRGLRFMEEAIELAQVVGCEREQLHRLIDFVYGRPVGEIHREFGGVGLTLLALAYTTGQDADLCEFNEFRRVLSKPLSEFTLRNQQKDDAGFKAR